MNTIRLKVRRTGSISRKHLTEAFCGITDLREHTYWRRRVVSGIKLYCNKKHFLPEPLLHKNRFCTRTLEQSGYGKHVVLSSIEHTLCKCIAATMHCICVVHLKCASTRLHGRLVILRSLRCVSLAFVRVNLSFYSYSHLGLGESMDSSSVNSRRKMQQKITYSKRKNKNRNKIYVRLI